MESMPVRVRGRHSASGWVGEEVHIVAEGSLLRLGLGLADRRAAAMAGSVLSDAGKIWILPILVGEETSSMRYRGVGSTVRETW